MNHDDNFRFERLPDGYRLATTPDPFVQIHAEKLAWSSGVLRYWMTVRARIVGVRTHADDVALVTLHDAMSARDRRDIAGLLDKRGPGIDMDWYGCIESLDQQILRAEREGEIGTLLTRHGVRSLADVPTDPPPPMLVERLDPDGHTILYGTGGVGKGVLAAWWVFQLVKAGHRVLIVDYEAHPTEWSRRIGSFSGMDAMADVFYVAPLTPEWTATRGPLWETADLIRAIAEEIGATYIVIDSIVPACAGMDPTQPEVASQYASALQLITRPALSLAHVTKADDARYPFGSVFWHNLARTTWSLAAAGEGGSHAVVLTHRKHNNYPNLGKYELTVVWREGLPVEVQERGYSPALAERIGLLLGDDGLTVAEIVTTISDDLDEGSEAVKPDSIRKALRRGLKERPQRFTVIGVGATARWSNA